MLKHIVILYKDSWNGGPLKFVFSGTPNYAKYPAIHKGRMLGSNSQKTLRQGVVCAEG